MTASVSAVEALRWSSLLTGLGVIAAAADLMAGSRFFSEGGLLGAADTIRRRLILLAAAQCVCGFLCMPIAGLGWVRSLALFGAVAIPYLSARLVPFGHDGSTQMLRVVAAALFVQSLAPSDALLLRASLWVIGMQTVLCYVTAGVTKLAMPDWRGGQYLREVFATEAYGREWAAGLVRNAAVAAALSRGVIAFECAFLAVPFAGANTAIAFCAAAAMFHLLNAIIMGLNLFVWSFAGAYPGLVFLASDVASMLSASATK
ncbi:MAG: hypothetical protein R2729_26195 [Bryobacteraceae bacterium]